MAKRLVDAARTPADQIRLTCLHAHGSSSLFNADRSEPRLHISTSAYNMMLRLRDGRPPAAILSYCKTAHCSCGASISDNAAAHWLTCPKLRGKQWARHNNLTKAWHTLAELCGVFSIEESHLPNGTRSDNYYQFPQSGIPYHTDTSVVHPACDTYLHSLARTVPGYAAKARASQKNTKYEIEVKRTGARFRAAIFETFGGCSPQVDAIINDFHEASILTGQPNPPSKRFMLHFLQKTLVEGNARIFAEGLKYVRLNYVAAHA